VEKEPLKAKRRRTPWVVGTLMVVSLATLVILQSTNLWKEFTIDSASDLLLLYALSSLNFIALVIFGFIFLRSIVKLMRERRTFEVGSKIKTRLLIYFFAVSLMPIIAMAVFSYLFMNRALERWFTQIPENVISQSRTLQQQAIADRTAKLDDAARMLASVLGDAPVSNDELERIAKAGNLSHIEIRSGGKDTIAIFQKPLTAAQESEVERVLGLARGDDPNSTVLRDGRGFDVAIAEMSGGRRLIVVPDPFAEESVSQVVDSAMAEFERLKQKQVIVRQVGFLTLGVLTFLLIFASSWIAFYTARGLTEPIKALAEGADEISRGNLAHRVDVFADDELELLVSAFNDMSAKLESNAAELREGRKYIETVLETLPTGVVSFDSEERVTTINSAAMNILRVDGDPVGAAVCDLVSGENGTALQRLLGRARRVGHASDQTVLKSESHNGNGFRNSEINVALTAARLPSDAGVVLVIEDLSELIAAQRASAWQEVARRMAHEIKNPLTPIQLSAERLAKRFTSTGHSDNGVGKRIDDKGPMGDVVHESTATILREVTSLKTLVDEFSRFARLPETELAVGDLNDAVLMAATTFDASVKDIEIKTELADGLPAVLIDREQMKSVFVNLIGNAIEAFDGVTGRRLIWITTRNDAARDLLVAEVSDNGKGIPADDFLKLFQPYFSTKGRGTGLGLAIVNRIIAEHHGRIKAVANQPKGAKFIIELPLNP
jgi:two-component system nitrogen regulation sensor histidine kinase NtrY